jgi:hypothetical protein
LSTIFYLITISTFLIVQLESTNKHDLHMYFIKNKKYFKIKNTLY